MDQIRNPVTVFMNAIANELHRDIHMHRRFKMHRYTDVVIPRLEKLAMFAQRFPVVLAITAFVALRLWGILLYPALLLAQALMALRGIAQRTPEDSKEIFFANSVISLISAKNASYQGKYIYASESLKLSGSSETSIGCIREYITASDVWSAFLHSIRSLFLIARTMETPGATFQVYAAFNWFLTWSVLHKIAGNANTIWIASDSDRWAVLFDQLQISARKVIIQHGLLNDPSGAAGSRTTDPLPTRLDNINEVILLNQESAVLYKKLVLSENNNAEFVSKFDGILQFSRHESDCNGTGIIIIGQHEFLEAECRLSNYLSEMNPPNIKIYLKPHPGHNRKKYKRLLSSRVEMVGDLDCLPLVRICLCFNYSTLAYLYERSGVEVIYLDSIQEEPLSHVKNRLHELGL